MFGAFCIAWTRYGRGPSQVYILGSASRAGLPFFLFTAQVYYIAQPLGTGIFGHPIYRLDIFKITIYRLSASDADLRYFVSYI